MDIRLLNINDVPRAKELWGYAFEKDEPFYSWYFNDYFHPENAIGVFFEDHLASYLQMNPYTLSLNGSSFDSSYVVGVITAPEYRNTGVMKRLLSAALEEMNQKNHFVSILMPFDTTFYRPYGWELSYSMIKYETPIDMIKDQTHREGSFHRITENDFESLKDIYNIFLRNNHGYVERNHRNWEVLLNDLSCYGGYAVILRDNDHHPMGYILYLIRGEKLVATEIAYVNQWAKKCIFGFMYSHKSQVTTLEWSSPLSDITYLSLRDTIQPKATNTVMIRPFMCGRVVNVKKALEHCRFHPHIRGVFSMKITDPYGPWNEKNFHVSIKNGIPHVEAFHDHVDITMDINAFSKLFFGAVDMDDLLSWEMAVLHNPEILDLLSQIFYRKNNYINEYF